MSNIYIYDAAKKQLVQKPEMEKPELKNYYGRPYSTAVDGYDMETYREDLERYNKSILSIKLYPCNFLPNEADGKEFVEGKDFKLNAYVCVYKITGEFECVPGSEHCNNYCNQNPAAGKMQDHPKIIAVPIRQEQEKPKGLQDIRYREARDAALEYAEDQCKAVHRHREGMQNYAVKDFLAGVEWLRNQLKSNT